MKLDSTISKTKLFFIIDRQYDLDCISMMLSHDDPAGIRSRSKEMEIPLDMAFEIAKRTPKGYEFAASFLNSLYADKLEDIKFAKINYQKSWDQVNDIFFNLLSDKTGHAIKHKKYSCVISAIHKGISNWGGNKIVRWYKDDAKEMRILTAHEIIISHVFNIFESDTHLKETNKEDIWKIAEITGWILTGKDKDFLKLWDVSSNENIWNKEHNYPQLYDLQDKVFEVYRKSNNFNSFLRESLSLINLI